MLDLAELGIATAGLMDTLDASDLPAEARVEEIMVIAAVAWPAGDEGETGQSTYYRCSSPYSWVQHGLLHQAAKAVDTSSRPYDQEEDEDE